MADRILDPGRVPRTGFEQLCYSKLQDAFGHHLENMTTGLIDKTGNAVSYLGQKSRGIDIETCKQYCGISSITWPNFNFHTFSGGMTNYLLPWLALTAQLPYETGGPWSDIMSFCLAVGSPALITHSLIVTMLNRYWINREFQRILSRGQHSSMTQDRIKAAHYVLVEGQQAPLRVFRNKPSLGGNLVMSDRWEDVAGRLERTRRGVTASLVAQLATAVIAYFCTIISAFTSTINDLNVVMQISAGTIWIWLVPVICGWVIVGTQYTQGTVEHALRANKPQGSIATSVQSKDHGLDDCGIVTTDLLSTQRSHSSSAKDFESTLWFGIDIRGDEGQKGPVFNYARLFTWSRAAKSLIAHASKPVVHFDSVSTGMTKKQSSTPTSNRHEIAYTPFGELGADVWWRLIIASVVALLIQWATSGASILMGYLTPTTGLGCRSGSYLLYGVIGTLVWVSMVASMLLSHAAMVHYEKRNTRDTRPSLREQLYRAMAVILRYIGKTIAAINASWLFVSTLFELIGFYDNCWCHGVELARGIDGYLILFRTSEEFREESRNAWAGGVAMTLIVCLVSIFIFAMASRRR